ncbi:MAG: hypothetical protein WD795_07000 [Woeseia sp.]
MKIGTLKRRADTLAEDAWTERREYKEHSARTLTIVRRRAGSAAGLAISFALGFMTGTGTAARKINGKGSGRHRGRSDRVQDRAGAKANGITHQLVHGPLGESAIKLASAVVASSLMKFLDDRSTEKKPSSGQQADTPAPSKQPTRHDRRQEVRA